MEEEYRTSWKFIVISISLREKPQAHFQQYSRDNLGVHEFDIAMKIFPLD